MRYEYTKARNRAIAASAGAALFVIPLTGAAAVALVSHDPSGPEADDVALQGEALADQVQAVDGFVVASKDATFDLNTPEIAVEELPPPPPVVHRSAARPISYRDDVAQAIAGSAIIAEASKYVGVPYVHGGTTPAGFDCSGFVSYVYAQFGISLPHSSGAYYSVGVRVSSPQPGDIIVTPGHVGLYAGPNLQIDAPTPGKTIQFRAIWQHNPTYVRVTG